MRRVRFLLLTGLAVVMISAVGGSAAYAWYLRSPVYRAHCAAELSRALGLPSDIGAVVPRSLATREFGDVVVWLPGRRDRALACERVLLVQRPTPEEPEAYVLQLVGGACEISARTWLAEDYRRVIESGLRPGFHPDGPEQVTFAGMDLRFERGQFRGALDGAAGAVVFESPTSAWAHVRCSALNGHVTAEPVALFARFSPAYSGIRIDEMTLNVPTLPLRVLRLHDLVGADVRHGDFSGQLRYEESADMRRTSLSGRVSDVPLAEVSAAFAFRPWRGVGEVIKLEALTLENGQPTDLRFSGRLAGLHLGDALAPWGLENAGGELTLRVRAAELARSGIDRLVASGTCEAVVLGELAAASGWGEARGTARLRITDLTIEQNRLASLDATLSVVDDGEPSWLEGRLVTRLVGSLLGMELPAVLPERIEVVRLGLRLEVRDEELYIFGSHGDRGKTILTVRLYGNELPLLREPEHAFDLRPYFDRWREALAERLREEARNLEERRP